MGKARTLRRQRERAAKAPAPAPVQPSRMELSLIAGGMRPEVARETAKVWAARHAWNNAGRGQ